MKSKKEYTSINLPRKSIADLKAMKIALSYTTGSIPNYEDVILEMIGSIEKTNPVLYGTYQKIRTQTK